MASATQSMLYLGRLADMDPGERNNTPENLRPVMKGRVFGSDTDPLFSRSTAVTLNDRDGNGIVGFDHRDSSDTIGYSLNGTDHAQQPDTGFLVKNGTIIQSIGGGATRTLTDVPLRIVQTANGDTFLMPPSLDNPLPGEAEMARHPILSVSIPNNARFDTGPFSGLDADRAVMPFRDGIVDGGAGNDLIDARFLDPAGDRIDAGDAVLPGRGRYDDTIRAGSGHDTVWGGMGSDRIDGGTGDDLVGGGLGPGRDDGTADILTGGGGFDRFVAGDGDTVSDFGAAEGAVLNDGNQANNDLLDLSAHYNPANLAIVNAAREAAGQAPYKHPLAWLRGDQADGVLDDIRAGGGFGRSFSMTVMNGGRPASAAEMTSDTTNVVCFSGDAMILTPAGPVAAGRLLPGMLVTTRDAGAQPIRWIGCHRLDAAQLAAAPHLRPIRIRRDALGHGVPSADLMVSPQHRILVRSDIARTMFGTNEVLVAARQLRGTEGIAVADDVDHVAYVHFLLDDHHIVTANGADAESLYAGGEALKAVGPAACADIEALFPRLRRNGPPPSARPLVPGRQARELAQRHRQHRLPLIA